MHSEVINDINGSNDLNEATLKMNLLNITER